MSAGKVDCVVVHTFDRLARSYADRETLFAAFERRGVTLATVFPAISDVIRENRMLDAMVVTGRRTAEHLGLKHGYEYGE
jgi:DNA invertase Pin-like site-specific DNA recombinase